MAEIVIVQAELGGTLQEDGTRPAVMIGGPADDVVLDLPARGRYTPPAVRLSIDGGPPVKYCRTGTSTNPRAPALYFWDWEVPEGMDERTVAWPISERIAQLARHPWPEGPREIPPRNTIGDMLIRRVVTPRLAGSHARLIPQPASATFGSRGDDLRSFNVGPAGPRSVTRVATALLIGGRSTRSAPAPNATAVSRLHPGDRQFGASVSRSAAGHEG